MSRKQQKTSVNEEELGDFYQEQVNLGKDIEDHLKIAEETSSEDEARKHNNAADRIQDDLKDEIKEKEEEVGVSTSNDSSKKQKKIA